MMFGYATNETANFMPVSLDLAQLIMRVLADIRKEGNYKRSQLFEVRLGGEIPEASASSWEMTLTAPHTTAQAVMGTEDSLQLRVRGDLPLTLDAVLSRYDTLVPLGHNRYEFHSYKCESKYLITVQHGQLEVNGPWDRVGHTQLTLTLVPENGEAALSFLGMGVQPPQASLGNMLNGAESLTILTRMPWLWIPPGLIIIILVVAINFIGDALRDAANPN